VPFIEEDTEWLYDMNQLGLVCPTGIAVIDKPYGDCTLYNL
jgi:hypothetical protein